jgi:hypothetical protein
MDKIKIPEGEKFFLFMVYVGLVGAALILLVDYTTKRQILAAAKEFRDAQGGQGGSYGPANHTGHILPADMGSMASGNDAGMEAGPDVEHVPFPTRKVAQPRDASGKFGPRDPEPNSGNGSGPIPAGNKPVGA